VQLRLAGKLTAFKLISLTNQEATSPTLSTTSRSASSYRREPDGSLFARIEGNQNGKPAHEDYPMKRGRCD